MNRPTSRLALGVQPIGEALAMGLLLGIADVNSTTGFGIAIGGYLFAGAVIGIRHARCVCCSWPVLGSSLYLVHVAAIACGYTPPYVEADYRCAEMTLLALIPSGIGLALGAFARVGLALLGWFRREARPAVRLLPRTTREAMVAIASIAVGLTCIHRVFAPPTLYAARYREDRFQAIRAGMTDQQVESALGPPLSKRETGQTGVEIWIYSDQYTPESNYERRWVFVTNGLVSQVVSEYWVD